MGTDDPAFDGDDGRTVLTAPTFDEMLAEREGAEALDALDGPTDPFKGAPPAFDPALAKTAMAQSFDEMAAERGEAVNSYKPPAPASGPLPWDPSPPPAVETTHPMGEPPPPGALPPSPFGGAPPAKAAPSPHPEISNEGSGDMPKTMMLSPGDWGAAGAPLGAPGTAPAALPSGPAQPGGAVPGATPFPGAAAYPGATPHLGAAAQPAAYPQAAAPSSSSSLKLFLAGLAVTFVVGSCLVTAVLLAFLR